MPDDRRPEPAAATTTATEGAYRMFVRDLVIACRIGAYDHEHEGSQRVRINLDLDVVPRRVPIDDNLDHVFSYDPIVDGVHQIAATGHINLLETLAERIAERCLADPHVTGVRVRVEKLDVFADAAGVGVEIVRRRR